MLPNLACECRRSFRAQSERARRAPGPPRVEQGFLGVREPELGLSGHVRQLPDRIRQREHVRRRRQRTVGFAGADVPREGEARPLARERGVGRAVRELDRRRPRSEHLRLRRPTHAVERSGRRAGASLVDLRRDRTRLPFRVVA
jgi:hypothetical protein